MSLVPAAPFVLALALTAAQAVEAGATEKTPLPTEPFDLTGAKTYSDLCLNAETANPYGQRIFILPAGRTPRVAAQHAFGLMEPPTAGRFIAGGGRLAFTVKGPTLQSSFRGEILGDEAVVRSQAPDAHTLRLPLRDDTQGLPDCP